MRPIRRSVFAMLGLALSGCTMPLGGPGYPPARPVAAPTAGYVPMAPQAMTGPVASGLSSGVTYFNTRPTDTVASVAQLYGVSEAELRRANNLKPTDQIAPGQLVRIPDGATAIR